MLDIAGNKSGVKNTKISEWISEYVTLICCLKEAWGRDEPRCNSPPLFTYHPPSPSPGSRKCAGAEGLFNWLCQIHYLTGVFFEAVALKYQQPLCAAHRSIHSAVHTAKVADIYYVTAPVSLNPERSITFSKLYTQCYILGRGVTFILQAARSERANKIKRGPPVVFIRYTSIVQLSHKPCTLERSVWAQVQTTETEWKIVQGYLSNMGKLTSQRQACWTCFVVTGRAWVSMEDKYIKPARIHHCKTWYYWMVSELYA